MALDVNDIEKIYQLLTLAVQSITEINNILDNKEAQKSRNEDENFDHAEMRNKKARELIDAL